MTTPHLVPSVTLRSCCVSLLMLLLSCANALAQAEAPQAQREVSSIDMHSPNGQLHLRVWMDDGGLTYALYRYQSPIISPSKLRLHVSEMGLLGSSPALRATERDTVYDVWEQPWGEQRYVRDHHHELALELQEQQPGPYYIVRFRLFDDGLGFRYEIPPQVGVNTLTVLDEATEFALPGDPKAWYIKAFQWNRYEYLYASGPTSALDTVHTPVTFEMEDGLFVSLHEAALMNYSSMALKQTEGARLQAELFPWSDGRKVYADLTLRSPWRTIIIGDQPGDLLTSTITLNLNEPSRITDTSWIEPGKYVGIWWDMHIGTATWESGPNHGATTARTRRYIDFAAAHGFSGVLVEGWNKGWEQGWVGTGDHFSFTEPYEDFDLEGLAAYAEGKGVRLIGHHETGGGISNYEAQMDDAYALYERLGIRAVKTGYVDHGQQIERIAGDYARPDTVYEWHHGQYMVEHYQYSVERAADNRIMLNVHEPIKDTGLRRTFPNLMTREGARGQEFNAWGDEGGNPPEHTVILPFTRMLSGPMDYTPGIFERSLPTKPANQINSTLAQQLALYVVLYSPLHMAADLPEHYEARPDAFQFIKDVPVDWDETRVLHSRIGDYITVVRKDRHSADWYLGSITDEHGRNLTAALSFLPDGGTYVAEVYADGREADYRDAEDHLDVSHVLVTPGTEFPIRLAPGGGLAVRFRPAGSADLQSLPYAP